MMSETARVVFFKDCLSPQVIRARVKNAFELMGGLDSVVRPGNTVLLKPNFVAPLKKAVTSFDIIRAVVEEVKRCGGSPIIAESSGFEFDTRQTFKVLGVPELAEALEVPLVNLDDQVFREVPLPGHPLVKTVLLPEILFNTDVFINLPRLKRHKVTDLTVGLKNLFGLPHRTSRRQMHAMGLTEGILALNRIVRSDVTIVDGTETVSSAAYGEADSLGFIIGGKNVVAVDRLCCDLLGVDYRLVEHVEAACSENPDRGRFEVMGDSLPSLTATPETGRSLRCGLHKRLFQLMHLSDVAFSKVFGGKSLIPWVNYYCGIRPVLIPERSGKCGPCANLCPVGAIDLENKRIIPERCMTLRCMRCVDRCPHGAFRVKTRLFFVS